jgi:hypothetical protein
LDNFTWKYGGYCKISFGSAGNQTSALAFGGYAVSAWNLTEEYDGTSWTVGGALGTARYSLSGCGTQTSALAFGGYTGTASTGATELYDGTSWTSNPNSMATARNRLAGCGTQTAGLGFGGVASLPATPMIASNRRIYRCRSSNKNNYSKLTGGKYGTYKNIHRS